MNLRKILITLFVMISLVSTFAFAEPGGPNMTPPDDYDWWGDSYFGRRDRIGYGDVENDPDAHLLTVYGNHSDNATPELGDHSIALATLAGISSLALAGAVVAHKKARSNAR